MVSVVDQEFLVLPPSVGYSPELVVPGDRGPAREDPPVHPPSSVLGREDRRPPGSLRPQVGGQPAHTAAGGCCRPRSSEPVSASRSRLRRRHAAAPAVVAVSIAADTPARRANGAAGGGLAGPARQPHRVHPSRSAGRGGRRPQAVELSRSARPGPAPGCRHERSPSAAGGRPADRRQDGGCALVQRSYPLAASYARSAAVRARVCPPRRRTVAERSRLRAPLVAR